MNKNTGLYSRAESLKHPSVIGELHVSDRHYWIILLEAEGGESLVSSNAQQFPFSSVLLSISRANQARKNGRVTTPLSP
jgi:hypothetical protein